jgi:hypothetical protein
MVDNNLAYYSLASELEKTILYTGLLFFIKYKNLLLKSTVLFLAGISATNLLFFTLYYVFDYYMYYRFYIQSLLGFLYLFYLLFRNYEIKGVSLKDIKPNKTYICFRKTNSSVFKDILLSFFGYPNTSVYVIADNSVYGYVSKNEKYKKINVSDFDKQVKCIKLDMLPNQTKLILNKKVGQTYSFKNNCSGILYSLFKLYSYNVNKLLILSPAYLYWKINKSGGI